VAQDLSDRIYILGAECIAASPDYSEFVKAAAKRLLDAGCKSGERAHPGIYLKADSVATPVISTIMATGSPEDAAAEVIDKCIMKDTDCRQCGSDVIRLSKVLMGAAYAFRVSLFRSDSMPQEEGLETEDSGDDDYDDLLGDDFMELNRQIISRTRIDELFVGDMPVERVIFHYKLHSFGEPAAIRYWEEFQEDHTDAEEASRFLEENPITLEEQERFEALTSADGWGKM